MATVTDPETQESRQIPPLAQITGRHELRDFFFAALIDVLDNKNPQTRLPGVTGQLMIDGTLFSYEFLLTGAVPPNREQVHTSH